MGGSFFGCGSHPGCWGWGGRGHEKVRFPNPGFAALYAIGPENAFLRDVKRQRALVCDGAFPTESSATVLPAQATRPFLLVTGQARLHPKCSRRTILMVCLQKAGTTKKQGGTGSIRRDILRHHPHPVLINILTAMVNGTYVS